MASLTPANRYCPPMCQQLRLWRHPRSLDRAFLSTRQRARSISCLRSGTRPGLRLQLLATARTTVSTGTGLTYYPLNQLKGATSAAGLILGWTYDSFGNRKTQTASGTGSAPQPSFTYSANTNRADPSGGFRYDASGNVIGDNLGQSYYYYPDDSISRVDTLGGTTTYRYDSEGHLAFENGPNGAQVFLYDQNGQILSNNNLTSGNVVQGATIDGEKIGSWQPNHFFWIGTDWLGTKRYESAGEGDISSQAVPITPASYTSLPFGDALSAIGYDPTHFTGKERDAESGLDYFGARYYSSSMGRFSSPDPSGLYYADPTNPQSLNLYAYALNNPLKNTDPTGLYCYYGDTGGGAQNDADAQDKSQFDYHSSQSECTAADENGNSGQWINDSETHQDASGNWVDNDNRPQDYTLNPSGRSGMPSSRSSVPSATLNLGVAFNYSIMGGITGTLGAGFILDTQGNLGSYTFYGGGVAVGAGLSAGVQASVSNGNSICAFGGPFANISATGGDGAAGTVDYYRGDGDAPGGKVQGVGGTLGVGGGGSASVTDTTTQVRPFGNKTCNAEGQLQ